MSFCFLIFFLSLEIPPLLRFNICFNQISFRDKDLDSSFSNIIKCINKNVFRKTETTASILSRKEYQKQVAFTWDEQQYTFIIFSYVLSPNFCHKKV